MDNSFLMFLETYLDAWKNSSLVDLKKLISQDYEAREVIRGDIVDFGYEESVHGWEQGFSFAKAKKAQWHIKVVSTLPLREEETMVILSATLIIEGKSLDAANLFFQTFKKYNNSDWRLVRSYIETGVTFATANNLH